MPFVAAKEFAPLQGKPVIDKPGKGDPGNYAAALQMVAMQNGVFGAVSSSSALLEALA